MTQVEPVDEDADAAQPSLPALRG